MQGKRNEDAPRRVSYKLKGFTSTDPLVSEYIIRGCWSARLDNSTSGFRYVDDSVRVYGHEVVEPGVVDCCWCPARYYRSVGSGDGRVDAAPPPAAQPRPPARAADRRRDGRRVELDRDRDSTVAVQLLTLRRAAGQEGLPSGVDQERDPAEVAPARAAEHHPRSSAARHPAAARPHRRRHGQRRAVVIQRQRRLPRNHRQDDALSHFRYD